MPERQSNCAGQLAAVAQGFGSQRCEAPHTPSGHVASVHPITQRLEHVPPQSDSQMKLPPSGAHSVSNVHSPAGHVQLGGTGPEQYNMASQSVLLLHAAPAPPLGIAFESERMSPALSMCVCVSTAASVGQDAGGQPPITQKGPPLQSRQVP
ncbi:MAG: hypothetical protein M3O46_11825 [Myxococcota bacterium]|nr:hypothetical protein [Myxococcota bacterium]